MANALRVAKTIKDVRTMETSLTHLGILWAVLSVTSSAFAGVGFYMPFWIRGEIFNKTAVTFGSFRRCTYPRILANGRVEIVDECGRYTTFNDIPSAAWQATSVLVGLGSSLDLVAALSALFGCCTVDALTRSAARTLGAVQFFSALLIVGGLVIYPIGWSSPEVQEACGEKSDVYKIGTCRISWSVPVLGASVVMLVTCSALSLRASRVEPQFYRI